jgi:uncharacterized protein YfkK (UPF0435 family)
MGVEKPEYLPNDHFKDKCIGFGLGTSKKEGEQAAAKMALINYGVLKEDQYTKADIYYPPWSLINNNDDKLILNNNSYDDSDSYDDNSSVYSTISKKSLE